MVYLKVRYILSIFCYLDNIFQEIFLYYFSLYPKNETSRYISSPSFFNERVETVYVPF
jgi:hypothetical protein